MSGWVDTENNPVSDYIDFARSVLRIPQAHEMIARYTVLDEDAKRLILLRPYQIHAIESIRGELRGQENPVCMAYNRFRKDADFLQSNQKFAYGYSGD